MSERVRSSFSIGVMPRALKSLAAVTFRNSERAQGKRIAMKPGSNIRREPLE